MLIVKELGKTFLRKAALDNVSFSIAKGEVVGLVGPNGSGKTTLLNILMSVFDASSGLFQIPTGTKVGMAVSRMGFFNDMSVKNNIFLYAKLQGVEEAHALRVMNEFMIDFAGKQFGKLSAGMKQRVSLTIPFLRRNDLILLDEPSNHLDIDSILLLRKKILELKESGTAFLITSHVFSDLEKICTRILFLSGGKIFADRSTSELLQEFGTLEQAYTQQRDLFQ